MRIAALDVGSNSFHLIVADVGTGGHINVLDRAKEMVRLGDSTLHTGVIPPEVFRRGAGRAARASPHRRSPQRRRAGGGRDQRRARGPERRRVRARGARRGGHRHPRHPRRRGGAPHLPGRARLARSRQAARGAVRSRRRLAGGHPRRRAGAVLHGLAQARRHPPGRDLPVLRSADARASAPSWPSACARCWIRSSRACAPWASTSWRSPRARRRRWPSVLRADKDTGSGKSHGRAARTRRRSSSGWATMSIAARARACRGSTRAAPTRSTRARSCFARCWSSRARTRPTLCETALREGIIADYVATNRPGILLVDEFPDLRRRTVMELARRCQFREDHGDARRAAGAVDLRPDAPAAQAGRGRRRAAGVRGAAARHRLPHLAPPPPPPQRVPDPEPRDDRILAGRGAASSRWRRATTARSSRSGGAGLMRLLSKGDHRRVRYLAAILRIADALDRTHARLVRAVRCSVAGAHRRDPHRRGRRSRAGDLGGAPQGRSVRGAGRAQAALRRRSGARAGGAAAERRDHGAARPGSPRRAAAVTGGRFQTARGPARRQVLIAPDSAP